MYYLTNLVLQHIILPHSYKQLMVDDCYALSLEYAKIAQEVPPTMFPITIAKQPELKAKNRFLSIMPGRGFFTSLLWRTIITHHNKAHLAS